MELNNVEAALINVILNIRDVRFRISCSSTFTIPITLTIAIIGFQAVCNDIQW